MITADRERWVDTMLAEEYGLPKVVRSPLKAAASTFASFVLCGAVPLLPFAFEAPAGFQLSIALTALVFFLSARPRAAGRRSAGGARAPGPWRSASAPPRLPSWSAMASRPWSEPGPRP